MEKRSFVFDYTFVPESNLLNPQQKSLLDAALSAAYQAYAPYSLFYVGAALLLENGQILKGANQENASYPCGICAERALLYHYGNLQPKIKILKMAISVSNNQLYKESPVAPCGLCRQVISEFEQNNGSPIELILGHPKHACIVIAKCNNLLPFVFNSEYLSKPV